MDLEQLYLVRASLKEGIRNFFIRSNFTEIDTPLLVTGPGTEVHLGYFDTTWNNQYNKENTLWLRSSPELHMKRSLC